MLANWGIFIALAKTILLNAAGSGIEQSLQTQR